MTEPIRLREGSRLGRYEIVRRLGAGAMGEVFLADDPQIGRRLAIKTVRVEEGKAHEVEERKRRLLREARAAGKLLHPNIVALFDAGEDQGVLYLAFEFVEGSDLAQRVAEGPELTLAEALAVVRQAAEALDYAHRQGVVHRDIKPSNLMITKDHRVKVADFGIAKVLDQTSDLTMTGSVVGSPHYLSPEQIRGDVLDGRTDVFSLGVLFYEILCNQRPFEADTLTTLVYRILNQEPTPIVVRRPDLGPRLEQLIQKMLAKERDARCASAGEVAAEIAACERELSPAQLAGSAHPEELVGGTLLLPVTDGGETVGGITAAEPVRQRTPYPPPPPVPSAPPRTASTVVRAATPAAAAPHLPAAAVPPPPPPPVPLAAPASHPTTDSTAFSPPAPPRSRLGLAALVAVGVIALLVVGGLAARRWAAGRSGAEVEKSAENVAATSQPESPATSARTEPPAAPREAPPIAQPEPQAVTEPEPEPEPARAPAVAAAEPAPATAPAFQPGERAPVTSRPPAPRAPVRAEPPPVPAQPRAESTPDYAPPARAEPYAAAPAEAAPAEAEPAPDPRAARDAFIARVPVQREMSTGMMLSFEVLPKDVAEQVVVRIDRIVIGRAAEWNAKKRGGRAYSIAEPGLHIVTFLLDGTELHRIRIDAQPGAGPTTIPLNLPQAKRGRRPGGGR